MAKPRRTAEQPAPEPEAGFGPSYSSNEMELVWLNPHELTENPMNWRTHPAKQRRALSEVLDSLGWLQPLLFNRQTQRLIDGHLRRDAAIERGIMEVPVLVVDIEEAKEQAALLSIDRLTGMAETEQSKERELIEKLKGEQDAILKSLLEGAAEVMVGQNAEKPKEEVARGPAHLVPGEQYKLRHGAVPQPARLAERRGAFWLEGAADRHNFISPGLLAPCGS